jgi:hypothetical protein
VKFEKKYYKYTKKTKKEKIIISNLLLMILFFSLDSKLTILIPKLLFSLKKYYYKELSINILLIIKEARIILDYYKGYYGYSI